MAVQRRSQKINGSFGCNRAHELVPILRARLRAWLEDVGARKSEVFEALLATTERSRTRSSTRMSPPLIWLMSRVAHR
jgi:hypothetical protein